MITLFLDNLASAIIFPLLSAALIGCVLAATTHYKMKVIVWISIFCSIATTVIVLYVSAQSKQIETNEMQETFINNDGKCIEIINIMIADGILQKYEKECIPTHQYEETKK